MARRSGGRPRGSYSSGPVPPQNEYELRGQNLWCQECGEVFNGPSRGEYAHTKEEKRRIDEAGKRVNPNGGLEGSVCGRRSCVDKQVSDTVDGLIRSNPKRDLQPVADMAERLRERSYEERRQNTKKFPGGFIDEPYGEVEGSE